MRPILLAALLFAVPSSAHAIPDPCPRCEPARLPDEPAARPWQPSGPNLWHPGDPAPAGNLGPAPDPRPADPPQPGNGGVDNPHT